LLKVSSQAPLLRFGYWKYNRVLLSHCVECVGINFFIICYNLIYENTTIRR